MIFDGLERDLRTGLSRIRADDEELPWWASNLPGSFLFFKVNATKNLAARETLLLEKVANADGPNYSSELDALRRWRQEKLALGIGFACDPNRKILVSVGAGSLDSYPTRAHDIAGFHRLVRLALEARKQQIGASAIPDFIRQQSQWAVHPVSGKPFAWDTEKRELVMETLTPPIRTSGFEYRLRHRPHKVNQRVRLYKLPSSRSPRSARSAARGEGRALFRRAWTSSAAWSTQRSSITSLSGFATLWKASNCSQPGSFSASAQRAL